MNLCRYCRKIFHMRHPMIKKQQTWFPFFQNITSSKSGMYGFLFGRSPSRSGMVAPDGSSSSPEITLKEPSVRRFVTHVEENPSSAHQKGNTMLESIGTVVLCQSIDCKNQPINGRSSQGTVYHSNAPLPAQSFPASSPTCDATFLFTHDGCNITSISISKSKSSSHIGYSDNEGRCLHEMPSCLDRLWEKDSRRRGGSHRREMKKDERSFGWVSHRMWSILFNVNIVHLIFPHVLLKACVVGLELFPVARPILLQARA